jgi:hypothetical protein
VEVRLYFNVGVQGAPTLVASSTRMLNEAAIPFNLKVAAHPGGYTRCDPAVLYLETGGFRRARNVVRGIVSACAPYLRSRTPAFAMPLAPGVALGEHRTDTGSSFGTSRCLLVAEGIVAAHERGTSRLADRVDAVARRFASRGLDIEVPYLAGGSAADYEL